MTKEEAMVNETISKMKSMLKTHKSICVGVSGGSDSNIIVHMICTEFREYLPKIHFGFQNTGLEFKATLRHLDFIEEHYGIKIERIKPKKGNSVVCSVRREGLPMVSKHFSHTMAQAQRGNAPSAIDKINGDCKTKDGEKSAFNFSPKQRALAQYLLANNIPCSDFCCEGAKKEPLRRYLKEIDADLVISGERRDEHGARSTAHSSCFEPGKEYDKFMPLFLWNDKAKRYYKEREGIRYSDCYEVYGMKRTGCAGCPFSSSVGEELDVMREYEPNLYKACMNVFGEAYRLMDKFEVHRRKILESQLTMEKWEKECKNNVESH